MAFKVGRRSTVQCPTLCHRPADAKLPTPLLTMPASFKTNPTPLLEADGVSRRFGGVVALDAVSIKVSEGEIFGLIGPNGAGKTTLFDILTGVQTADAGLCRFAGQPLPSGKPHEIVARGIARTFQNIRLFGELSVLDNVLAGLHSRMRSSLLATLVGTDGARTEADEAQQMAMHALEEVGLAARVDTQARHLSYGDQRRLEIARALVSSPRLLALDEPAAGMNRVETDALRALIERTRARGVTVLLIEHDMHLVMRLCDRIAVLDSGRNIALGRPDEVRRDPRVVEAYLGGGRT